MLIALQVALDIVAAQHEQDEKGHLFQDGRKYYVLPAQGFVMRAWLFLLLPRSLYKCIEWTPDGAVFLARKDNELY
jgi:hypothetical protein